MGLGKSCLGPKSTGSFNEMTGLNASELALGPIILRNPRTQTQYLKI